MGSRFASPFVFCICLALVLTNLTAADRTKSATRAVSSNDDSPSAAFSELTRRVNLQSRSMDTSATSNAEGLLRRAAEQEGAEAISTLMEILSLDLAESAQTEKLLADVYDRLAQLYEGAPTKQVHWYSLAMQYSPDPGERAVLETRIADLGGDAFAFAVTPSSDSATPREVGYDTCDDAIGITLPLATSMSIAFIGDHDWFAFDLAGPDGAFISIATNQADIYTDTDLILWDGCPGTELAFDDDGGPGFLSLIETGCMAPGTYYVEVGGWLDFVTPQDFDLTIDISGTCWLPAPDAYEPDDDPADATEIGWPTSIPLHANGWGRSKREIQQRSIYPAGDVDFTRFRITGSEMVRMGTAATFPTFFNNFASSDPLDNPDTEIELWYGEEPDYGGYCNNPPAGFPNFCMTDEDCVGLVVDPLPGWPDCISFWDFWIFSGVQLPDVWPPVTSILAHNNDRGSLDSGAELFVCLPRGDEQTPSLTAAEDWMVRVQSHGDLDTFDYQLQVKNEVGCDFELEPNNDFPYATPLAALDNYEIHGIYDFFAFELTPDADLFSFDVDEVTALRFETDGYDSFKVDTALELFAGPDDSGNYFFTGASNDDCVDWLSCLDVALPPASELLGNISADADYFINVTSWWFNMNYPYTLRVEVVPLPTVEIEPNDSCDAANDVDLGDTMLGAISLTCDYDSFNLSLAENTYVSFETDGSSDTVMALETMAGEWLACDDDGGPVVGSRIEGCLPPGDYCVRLRPYGYWDLFDYELSFSGTAGCLPTDPPLLIQDGVFRCDGAGYSGPEEEFNTCPN